MTDEVELEMRQNVSAVIGQPPEAVHIMRIRPGSKMRNLIAPCAKQTNDHGYTLLFGFGNAVGKLVSIAEIVKRKLSKKSSAEAPSKEEGAAKSRIVQQANKIKFSVIEEHWDPKDDSEGLEPLKVTRQIPSMGILLTVKDYDLSALAKDSWTVQDLVSADSLSNFLSQSQPASRKKKSGAHAGSQYVKRKQNKPRSKRPKQDGGAGGGGAGPDGDHVNKES